MDIHKRLWNWCRRPKRPVLTKFTRLATPLYVSVLIGGLILTAYVAVVFLPPMAFKSSSDESGRVTEVVERVLFPGGAVVVYEHPIYETPKWYISIKVHNYITCEDDLLGYVNSRKNALNELLGLISIDENLQVTVTFKEALESTDFRNLYRKYLGDGPYHWAIVVENETSKELETIALNAPNPDYFDEYFPYPKEGLKIISVIAFETLIDADAAKTLKQDPRILLVDPQECLTVRGLVRKYTLKGFEVTVNRPPLLLRVFEPESTCGTTNIEELLANPSKYDRWRLYLAGKVSDLDLLEGPFFKLNEKLLVCYKYYEIDLSKQIVAEGINNRDYVIVIGTFFQERSTMYAHKIEKANYSPPEELLSITLDKEIYSQGDKMNITIKNISNETIWFTDTAYSLAFEKFDGVDWEFHTGIADVLR